MQSSVGLREIGEFDLANPWDGVGFDHELVAASGGEADIGFGVEVVPGAEPGGYSVLLCTDYVQVVGFLQNFGQFSLDFCLVPRMGKEQERRCRVQGIPP